MAKEQQKNIKEQSFTHFFRRQQSIELNVAQNVNAQRDNMSLFQRQSLPHSQKIEEIQPPIHGKILCPLCSIAFTPSTSNLCASCQVADAAEQKLELHSDSIFFCSYCNRYNRPPWTICKRESPELLSALLKKVKLIKTLTIKDARFVWTEPHSRRLKIRLQIVVREAVKSHVLEFIEVATQCNDCKKQFTAHDWSTVIQVRQHTRTKRTVAQLERVLLPAVGKDVYRVQTVEDGIDLYFQRDEYSHKYVEIIKNHCCAQFKQSKQLISHNERDNSTNVKHTFSALLPNVSRHDLVRLHPLTAKELGVSSLILCTKMTAQMQFLDVSSMRLFTMPVERYFHYEPYITVFQKHHHCKTYTVLDNEGPCKNNVSFGLVITPTDELAQIYIRSHLDLKVGDQVQGYYLKDNQEWCCKNAPDVLLVKKYKKQKHNQRKQTNTKNVSSDSQSQLKDTIIPDIKN